MPETVILRFRDHRTDVDTIKAHAILIRKFKYVWWGWWRKDSEPRHKTIIQELGERARKNELEIGLFDLSTSRYFVASASDFLPNSRSRGSPDAKRTPSYYPDSRKVEAWIKLDTIKNVSLAEFIRKFGEPPISEHTFFPISKEHKSRETKPEDFTRVRSDCVVHISDIHLGADHGFPLKKYIGKDDPVIERVKRDINAICEGKIGLIVVSGDLGSRGDGNTLLIEGLDFLNALHRELEVPKEAMLVIPGNHDFRLSEYQPTDFSHERPFNTTLREFYGAYDPDERFRRFVFPSGRHVEFLLINSVRLRKTEEANYGYVEWPLYESRLRARRPDADVTRIAVLHHHLISMPREELLNNDYCHAALSTTIDSGAVIEGLQAHGFRLALHGHQHVPGIARISRGVIDGNNEANEPNDLEVLSAGSAGED